VSKERLVLHEVGQLLTVIVKGSDNQVILDRQLAGIHFIGPVKRSFFFENPDIFQNIVNFCKTLHSLTCVVICVRKSLFVVKVSWFGNLENR